VADKWGYDRENIYQAIRRADAYVALTTFERDYVVQKGVPEDQVAVIGGGVDMSDFADAEGRAMRKRYGWRDAPVVGVIARQSALKRLDIVLQAMLQVWDRYPDVHLVMAGARTSHTLDLEQMIAAFPPEKRARVTLINDFSEQEKPKLIAACDLVAHPSGNESFGIVFIEAWACGKPVVGARIGAIPSVIDDGKDGLLFRYLDADDMARAILDLLSNRSRRIQMGQAGRDKVLQSYTWEVVTDQLRSLYEKVAL
jgi:glycosyltransferase involved in cell wall biosynthesis